MDIRSSVSYTYTVLMSTYWPAHTSETCHFLLRCVLAPRLSTPGRRAPCHSALRRRGSLHSCFSVQTLIHIITARERRGWNRGVSDMSVFTLNSCCQGAGKTRRGANKARRELVAGLHFLRCLRRGMRDKKGLQEYLFVRQQNEGSQNIPPPGYRSSSVGKTSSYFGFLTHVLLHS